MIPKESLLEGTPIMKQGVDYSKFKLTPKEAFLMSRIDGRMKLKEIIHLSSMGQDETLAAMLSLTLKEVITFKEYTLEQIKGQAPVAAKGPPSDPRSAQAQRPPVAPQRPASVPPQAAAKPQQAPAPAQAPAKPQAAAGPAKPPVQQQPAAQKPAPAPAQPVSVKPTPQPVTRPPAPKVAPPPASSGPIMEVEEEPAQSPDAWSQMDVKPQVQEFPDAFEAPVPPPAAPAQVAPAPIVPPAAPVQMPPRPAQQGPRLAQPFVPKDDVVEDLSDLKMSGKFVETSYPKLLATLFKEKHTGILRIFRQKNGPYKEVYYRSGIPIYIGGNYLIEKECLGQLLKMSGKISDYDFEQSVETMKETRDLQGQILLRMGVINNAMLNGALKWQLEIKLAEMFTWKLGEGYFEFYQVGSFHRPIDPVQVNIAGIILKGVKRGFPFTAIQARLGPLLDKYPVKRIPPPFPVDDFKFQLPEQRLWDKYIEGLLTGREIMAESKMDPQHVQQFLFVMDATEMLDFKDRPAGGTDEDKVIADLKDRLALSQKGSLFEGLGIHWTSVGHHVQEGWEKVQREYGPESKYQKMDFPEVIELSKKIYEMGKKAYEALIDDKRRVEYRSGMYNETKIILSAELLYQQAESQLLWKEDYVGALGNLEPAAELQPRNFVIQAAFATALIKRNYPNTPEKYRQGEQIIMRAIAAASNNDMVHFYAGHAFWALHRTDKARGEFEAALRINPSNSDARKALRALNK